MISQCLARDGRPWRFPVNGFKFSVGLDRSQRSGQWFHQVAGNRQATSRSHIAVVGDSEFPNGATCEPRSRGSSGTCTFECLQFGGGFGRHGQSSRPRSRCPPQRPPESKTGSSRTAIEDAIAQTDAFIERSRQRIKKLEVNPVVEGRNSVDQGGQRRVIRCPSGSIPARPREVVPPERDALANRGSASSWMRSCSPRASGQHAEARLQVRQESTHTLETLCEVVGFFARAEVPESVLPALSLGRMTALKKPSGGARGIVVSDVFRRLVAPTLAQQFAKAGEVATAQFQCALSTRARCECIAHASPSR